MFVLLVVEKFDQAAVADSSVFIAWEKIEPVGGSKRVDEITDERSFSSAGIATQEVDSGTIFRQRAENRLLP